MWPVLLIFEHYTPCADSVCSHSMLAAKVKSQDNIFISLDASPRLYRVLAMCGTKLYL